MCIFVVGLLVTGEGLEFIHFAYRFPPVLGQLVAFSVCSAVGQVIISSLTSFRVQVEKGRR